MLFNSFSFLIFFPAVALLYYAVPRRLRPILLLLASCQSPPHHWHKVGLPDRLLRL
jgi:hypothetical protein